MTTHDTATVGPRDTAEVVMRRLDLKEFLVAVPLIASGAALAWEIGTFFPIGGFWFFTLAEHIVAAAPALPSALILSALLPIVFRADSAFPREKPGLYAKKLLLLIGIFSSSVFGMWLAMRLRSQPGAFYLPLLIAFSPPVSVTIDVLFLRGRLGLPLRAAIFGITLITFTMTTAAFVTLVAIKSSETGKGLATITMKEGDPLRGRILMVGQQGILFYAPDLRQVRFERIDGLKRVEWPTILSIR
jgi:hypothetical protein